MSNSSLIHLRGWVNSVLHNGVGRYVPQLQRLTLKFCKSQAGSRGMREFVEMHLLDFTHKNPGTVIYLQPRRHQTPILVGEYLNGNTHRVPVPNLPSEEICKWVNHLRTKSGQDAQILNRAWRTDTPSIQGVWTPFTNRPSSWSVMNFPSDSREFKSDFKDESTTDYIKRLANDNKNIILQTEHQET